jgi:putative transposase
MPDHLHALIEGTSEQADSRKFAHAFRQVSGFHFKQARGSRLWQEGYYDHVLREEEATLAVARYIVLNPVRAGLCADASGYRLLGSTRYTIAELLTAADWYPPSQGHSRRASRSLG